MNISGIIEKSLKIALCELLFLIQEFINTVSIKMKMNSILITFTLLLATTAHKIPGQKYSKRTV